MVKKYMFSIYLCSAIIMLCFSLSSEKQFITNASVVFGFDDFIQILLKNTVASIWLLSAYLLGDMIIYIFFITNGIVLGALLSSFPNMFYLLLVIPHGVIEVFSYIYLSDTIINHRKGCYDKQDFIKRLKISFLLLILGAGIEAFITPLMINFIKNIKLFVLSIFAVFIFVVRYILISKDILQDKFRFEFNVYTMFIFIVISLIITIGVFILNIHINYYVISKLLNKFCDINVSRSYLKNSLYYTYISAYSIANFVLIILGLGTKITDQYFIFISVINYVLVSLLLLLELKKLNVPNKVNILLASLIFLGNSLTILYMML